jgi:hypothetical protein
LSHPAVPEAPLAPKPPPAAEPTAALRKGTFVASIAGLVISGIPLVVWPLALFTAPMMFDAPGATADPKVWLTVAAVVGYPLPWALAALLTWLLRRRRRYGLSLLPLLLPLVPAIALLLL